MNVLLVIHVPKQPQLSVYHGYQQLANFLEQEGHRALIMAPEDFASLRRLHARWFPLLYPFYVARWLVSHSHEYDLAVFHSYAGWVVNILRRWLPAYDGLRTVTSFHGLEPLYYVEHKREMQKAGTPLRLRFRLVHGVLMPFLIAMSCRRSDRIRCLNKREADYIECNRWGKASNVIITPRGVPAMFLVDRSFRAAARRLIFVGQWREMKGTKYLVDAFVGLAKCIPDLELWCAGTLVGEDEVLAAFPESVRERVTVRPRLDQTELLAAYRDADIFVFPTLSEGFSMALLEAMATALPVVATPVGAAPEIVKSDMNGMLVPARDAEALSCIIKRLLDDQNLRERLGREAQAKAAEYETAKVHNRLLSMLRDVAFSRP
jgi:glycosyltransferase involved in cell wall biosynthesis